MLFSSPDIAATAEELLVLNNNNINSYHQTAKYEYEDLENELEPCLRRTTPNLISSENYGRYKADSNLKKSGHVHYRSADNIRKYLGNRSFNSAVRSNFNDGIKDVPFIKRIKCKPDCFSVKFSVIESDHFINENDRNVDLVYKSTPEVMESVLQKKCHPQKLSSHDYDSENVVNNESTEKAQDYMPSNLAASSPSSSLQETSNSDSIAASFNGSHTIQHQHPFDVEPLHHSKVQSRHRSMQKLPEESEKLMDSNYSTQLSTQAIEICSCQPECFCAMNFVKFTDASSTSPHRNVCSNHACLCRLSLYDKDKEIYSTAKVTQSKSDHLPRMYSLSDHKCNRNRIINTNPCFQDSCNSISTEIKSTDKVHKSEYIPYNSTTSTTSWNNCFGQPPFNDNEPLRVFVPKKEITSGSILTDFSKNKNNQHGALIADNNVSEMYHRSLSNFNQPNKVSSNDLRNFPTTEELSNHVNTVHEISNALLGKDDKNTSINPYPTTFPSEKPENCLFPPFYSYSENHANEDNLSPQHPYPLCKHTTCLGHISAGKNNSLKQIQNAENPEFDSFKRPDLPTSNGNQGSGEDSQFKKISDHGMSNLDHTKSYQDEFNTNLLSQDTNYKYIVPQNLGTFQDSNRLLVPEDTIVSHTNNKSNGILNDHSNDCRDVPVMSVNASQNYSNQCHSHNNNNNNKDHMRGHFLSNKRHNLEHEGRKEVAGHSYNNSQIQAKNHGFRSEIVRYISTSYIDVPFNGSEENLVRYTRSNDRSSVPSSIDSGHPPNWEGSLQRLSTSEFAYVKATSGNASSTQCSDRIIPDYSYLCVVATVLNPVFGLIAFLCNYYARMNFQRNKLVKANNFYFATITVSTVAIFLTLVGATLLITHSLVSPTEKRLSPFQPAKSSYECRYLCSNESIKSFFDIDMNLYREITKNEKIMLALQHFWLEEIENRKKFQKPMASKNGSSNINAYELDYYNATEKSVNSSYINYDTKNETNVSANGITDGQKVNEKSTGSMKNRFSTSVPRPQQASQKNDKFHNTILSSNNGPVVPPALEKEYQLYLQGNREAKIGNASHILRRPQFSTLSTTKSKTETITEVTVPSVNVTSDNSSSTSATPP